MVRLSIELSEQRLYLFKEGQSTRSFSVASSRYGHGQREGSWQTPLGAHFICALFGEGAPLHTRFVARVPQTESWSEAIDDPDKDWILSRILWLAGSQPGINQGGDVDTRNRFIYIHGTPPRVKMGEPSSIGCIRMDLAEVAFLFSQVTVGTEVIINE